jgi:hypothetical protein
MTTLQLALARWTYSNGQQDTHPSQQNFTIIKLLVLLTYYP